MEEFPGLLTRDFGLRPQGKAAPMAPSRSSAVASSYGVGSNSYFSNKSDPIFDDHDQTGGDDMFRDVFKYSDKQTGTMRAESGGAPASSSSSSFDYDSIFKDRNLKPSLPVFDKPVYDEDIFEGLPGMMSAASRDPLGAASMPMFDGSFVSSPKQRSAQGSSSAFDDLLGDFQKESVEQTKSTTQKSSMPLFDDLIPGFGRSNSTKPSRPTSEASQLQRPSSDSDRAKPVVSDDPFPELNPTTDTPGSSGFFVDPLEEIGKFNKAEGFKVANSFPGNTMFDDLNSLGNMKASVSQNPIVVNNRGKDRDTLFSGSTDETYSGSKDVHDKQSSESVDAQSYQKVNFEELSDSTETESDIHSSASFHKIDREGVTSPTHLNGGVEKNYFSRSEGISDSFDDVWLTVSEVPLYTQPTMAPPPSRPPPPRPPQISRSNIGSQNLRRKVSDFSTFTHSSMPSHASASAFAESKPASSQLDEFDSFLGGGRSNVSQPGDVSTEGVDSSEAAASAAAMKEAMGRAEATFRQMKEREFPKSVRSKVPVQADHDVQDAQERELKQRMEYEKQQREKEEKEREKRRQELDKEREEREREQLRLERAREAERERERARQAVERATREARERAAVDARMKAEKAAVEKAANEARQRAARAAVQKVQAEARERAAAEARERAAAEARERAEKAAAEAREKSETEAREREAAQRAAALKAEADAKYRVERAAVERVAAEARQRAAAAAAAAAAASARVNQPKNEDFRKDENDLESFFSSRASSAPRPRATTSDPFFDTQNKGWQEGNSKPSVGSTTNMRKASSTTNIVDDLSSIFGGGPSPGEFQEVEGESDERRKARMERHQRTQERALKALAEKNQRDLQAQREQAERHRIAETLDAEIKRWAAGKEGNLRALLSTLQYVLWPECGWQPVSLTDLITAASVKKVYRKATLCIHPDKVQQKGASLQQKYIAEKVFDLLKEAWNKFNSEELF